MNDIMKIVKTLEKPGLLTKGISETVQNEVKKQNWGLLGMLVATLASSFPGNMLVPKDVIRAGEATIRASEGEITVRQDF